MMMMMIMMMMMMMMHINASFQVDSLLSDGLDPPCYVCPHSHLSQSGADIINLWSCKHLVSFQAADNERTHPYRALTLAEYNDPITFVGTYT